MPAAPPRTTRLAAALVVSACTPELVQIGGERILYEHDPELVPCAGNVAYLDQVVPFLEQQTGLKAPDMMRFSWLTFDNPEAWILYADRKRDVVTAKSGKSVAPVSTHELTHLVTGTNFTHFFTEGVAQAMEYIQEDGGYIPNDRYVDPVWLKDPEFDPRRTLTALKSPDVNYGAAGAFVLFLLVHHGPEKFADFYRGLNGPATEEWIGRQFSRAYGLDLNAEIDRFLAGIPPCPVDAFPVVLAECSGPTIPWEQPGELWRYEASMACDEPGVIGGIDPRVAFSSFRAVTLDVTETDTGTYQLSLNDLEQVRLRFGPCFGCPWDLQDVFVHKTNSETIESATVTLKPGKYYVRIASESDLAPDISVQLRR